MLKFVSAIIIGITVFFAVNPSAVAKFDPTPDLRVLFIGNSFTFGGDIPTQVKNIAATTTPPMRLEVDMVARAGTSLGMHLAETDALARIQEGDWDVVVLQDTSVMSFRPDWRAQMMSTAATFATAATERGIAVIYFAHWAPRADYIDLRNQRQAIRIIEQNYDRLSLDTGGTTARAGRVWQEAADAGVEGLYSADNHHASVKGAFAAALALSGTITNSDVTTSTWAPDGVSETDRAILRAAAAAGRDVSPVVVNRANN